MAQPKIPFDSIDLMAQPDQIINVSFVDLIGRRADIADWDGQIQRLQGLYDRYFNLEAEGSRIYFPEFEKYFIEATNWLQGKTPTTSWIQLGAYGIATIPVEIFNQFRDSWIGSLEGQFNGQPYIVFEQAVSQVRNVTSKLGGIKLNDEASDIVQKLQNDVETIKRNIVHDLEKEKNDAVSQIKTAQGLQDWVEYYETVENDYTLLIEGTHVISKRQDPNDNEWPIKIKRRKLKGDTTINGFRLGEAKKRLAWFAALALIIIIPCTLSLFGNEFLIGGVVNPFYTDISSPDLKIQLVEKLKYLPIVLVLTFGYAFTNKNYRILSNLREQYRHRKTVSRTLQGIVTSIDENEQNRDIRVKLIEIGAKAMFDLKTIGHLTKRDSESSPMAEIIQTIVPTK